MTLLEAVAAGDLAAAKQVLPSTQDINQLGDEGRTPLILAAMAGRADLVSLLLEAGAEPSWRDSMEETALLKAAALGHLPVVRLLMPHAREDEKHMAQAFLSSLDVAHAPEFTAVPDLKLSTDDLPSPLKKKAVGLAARAANFVGYEEPLKRVERAQRSEDAKKKK